MLIIVQRMSNKRYEISRKYHMIATKRTAALIAALSLLGTVAPAAFAQDGSLVNLQSEHSDPQRPNLSFNPNIWFSATLLAWQFCNARLKQDQSNSPADGESPPPPP